MAQVFARRGYNIAALVVSPSVNQRFSRMTITAIGDPGTLDQIIKQCSKLIDVLHVSKHAHENAIEVELALLKIKYKPSIKAPILKIIKRFHAHVIDTTDSSMIIEQTGTTERLDEFESLVKKYGIVEMVRTGKVVMARGREPT